RRHLRRALDQIAAHLEQLVELAVDLRLLARQVVLLREQLLLGVVERGLPRRVVAELRAALDQLGARVGDLLALALQRAGLADEVALVLAEALVLGGDRRDVRRFLRATSSEEQDRGEREAAHAPDYTSLSRSDEATRGDGYSRV